MGPDNQRIASDRQSVHDSGMTDEDFRDLEHAVGRHDGELDMLLKRIEHIEEDLKMVVKYSQSLRTSILSVSNQSGNSSFDQDEVKRCQDFRDKYQLGIG